MLEKTPDEGQGMLSDTLHDMAPEYLPANTLAGMVP